MGENFGHVFLEALAAGCPLIISNKTPWLELKEKGVGWDLPIDNGTVWRDKLNECVGVADIEPLKETYKLTLQTLLK